MQVKVLMVICLFQTVWLMFAKYLKMLVENSFWNKKTYYPGDLKYVETIIIYYFYTQNVLHCFAFLFLEVCDCVKICS